MCIIFILYQVHPTYPLIIASNRDETLNRPTESMKLRSIAIDATTETATATLNDDGDNNTSSQQDEEFDYLQTTRRRRRARNQQQQQQRSYLAGRDLVCGGTWLALDVSSMMKVVDLDDDDDGSSIARGGADCTLDVVNNNAEKKDDDISSNDNKSTTPSLLKWIAITNYREKEDHGRPSRGELLTEYITAQTTQTSCAQSFLNELQQKGQQYNGFNLVVGDDTGIYYYSNRSVVQDDDDDGNKQGGCHNDDSNNNNITPPSTMIQRLMPGRIYGLSNALLDTPWPKVQRGKELLEQLLLEEKQKQKKNESNNSNNHSSSNNNSSSSSNHINNSSSLKQLHEKLMTILHDTTQPPNDADLPNTGIGLHSERHLSSIFVPVDTFMGREYGTRSSTSVVMDLDGCVSVLERSWSPEKMEEEVVDEWFYFRQENE